MSPSSVLRATARRPLRHIYAEKEHLKTLSLIKETSNMNNHRQIKDYRCKRPKEDAKLQREPGAPNDNFRKNICSEDN